MEIPADIFATRLVAEGTLPEGYVAKDSELATSDEGSDSVIQQPTKDDEVVGGIGGRALTGSEKISLERDQPVDRTIVLTVTTKGSYLLFQNRPHVGNKIIWKMHFYDIHQIDGEHIWLEEEIGKEVSRHRYIFDGKTKDPPPSEYLQEELF
jgi:hypothetical protein